MKNCSSEGALTPAGEVEDELDLYGAAPGTDSKRMFCAVTRGVNYYVTGGEAVHHTREHVLGTAGHSHYAAELKGNTEEGGQHETARSRREQSIPVECHPPANTFTSSLKDHLDRRAVVPRRPRDEQEGSSHTVAPTLECLPVRSRKANDGERSAPERNTLVLDELDADLLALIRNYYRSKEGEDSHISSNGLHREGRLVSSRREAATPHSRPSASLVDKSSTPSPPLSSRASSAFVEEGLDRQTRPTRAPGQLSSSSLQLLTEEENHGRRKRTGRLHHRGRQGHTTAGSKDSSVTGGMATPSQSGTSHRHHRHHLEYPTEGSSKARGGQRGHRGGEGGDEEYHATSAAGRRATGASTVDETHGRGSADVLHQPAGRGNTNPLQLAQAQAQAQMMHQGSTENTLSGFPTYSSTSFVRAYISESNLNLQPAVIVSSLAAMMNIVAFYFLQHHVLDTRDHLGLFLIGSYLVFSSYYMIYYFLERFSASFRRIHSQDKKFYIIGNLLKAGVLISITPFAVFHLTKIILFDEWQGETLQNLGCIYAIPDFISMIIVKRMRWSTWIHHLCVVLFNYFSILNDYQNENVLRCVVVYASFSSFAYCVNVLLASRFLGVSASAVRVLSFMALLVYAGCCAVNWCWQAYYLHRLISTGHHHWSVYVYMCMICLVMYDDMILTKWLWRYAKNTTFAASQLKRQQQVQPQRR